LAETGPNPARRPRTLLALAAVFCWVTGQGLEGLTLPARSASYHFLSGLGVAPLHFVLEAITVAVALAALSYLWRGRYGWVQTSLVALGYLAVQSTALTLLMLGNLASARASYVASRADRGLPVDPEGVEELLSPAVLVVGLVISLTLFAIAGLLAWRRRDYVAPDDPASRGRW
jgi:hypothetical protein